MTPHTLSFHSALRIWGSKSGSALIRSWRILEKLDAAAPKPVLLYMHQPNSNYAAVSGPFEAQWGRLSKRKFRCLSSAGLCGMEWERTVCWLIERSKTQNVGLSPVNSYPQNRRIVWLFIAWDKEEASIREESISSHPPSYGNDYKVTII